MQTATKITGKARIKEGAQATLLKDRYFDSFSMQSWKTTLMNHVRYKLEPLSECDPEKYLTGEKFTLEGYIYCEGLGKNVYVLTSLENENKHLIAQMELHNQIFIYKFEDQ